MEPDGGSDISPPSSQMVARVDQLYQDQEAVQKQLGFAIAALGAIAGAVGVSLPPQPHLPSQRRPSFSGGSGSGSFPFPPPQPTPVVQPPGYSMTPAGQFATATPAGHLPTNQFGSLSGPHTRWSVDGGSSATTAAASATAASATAASATASPNTAMPALGEAAYLPVPQQQPPPVKQAPAVSVGTLDEDDRVALAATAKKVSQGTFCFAQ